MADLFIYLMIGHFIFDWLFQYDWQAINKKNGGMALWSHCIVYSVGVWLMAWVLYGHFIHGGFLAALLVSHLLLDTYKFHKWWCVNVKGMHGEIPLWMLISIDQIWHTIVIFLVAVIQTL